MSWFRKSVVGAVAAGMLAVAAGTARADLVRGYFNNWGTDCELSFNAGNYYEATIQASNPGDSQGMKLNNGNTWWGKGTSATVNGSIGEASTSGGDNLDMDVVKDAWYTFHVAGHGGWNDRKYLVMKTHYKPAVIQGVTDDHATQYEENVEVTVRCALSADMPSISDEEVFYLVYTTDGWATQTRQVMTKSGVYARGTIPGQTAGTTVTYYVFSSAMPASLFTDAKIWSVNSQGESVQIDQFGFCMLSADNNGGQGYSYTTVSEDIDPVAGNAWHCPTNAEPYASATMRAPLEVAMGDHPYIRLGVNPASGADAPTKVQLKYKAGTNNWATLSMKPEPRGDGWQSRYDGNAYYTNFITTNKFTAGMTVQYYFHLEYTNSSSFAETSVGTTDQTGSVAYLGADAAKAHPFSFTVAAAPALPLANHVWHVPDEYPAGWSTPMRNPCELTEGVTNVAVFLGNYQADTDGENLTGGSVFYSIDGGAFAERPLVWGSEQRNGENNGQLKFWKYDIDTTGVAAGQTLRYYFAANVDGHATTYVISDGSTNMLRVASVDPATDNLFTATCGGRVYNLGNAWHVPGQYEPWPAATMRKPCYPSAGEAICFFVGNQAYGDGGNPGDMSGGTLYHRAGGASAWNAVALEHETDSGNNKYWKAILPDGTYASAGDMEYYVEVNYNDHDTTYLGTDSGARSQTFATAAEAQQHLFTCPIGGEPGTEPGYMWHAGNAVPVGTNAVQFWVKIGYAGWADTVELHYRFKDGAVPASASKSGRTAKRRAPKAMSGTYSTAAFGIDHEEADTSEYGNAVWWVCTLSSDDFLDSGKYLEYEIMARKGSGPERFADYHTSSAATLFYFTMFKPGSGTLTVNGMNADYTTSKFFIEEKETGGDTVTLNVVYEPPATGLSEVQVFHNVGRRDYWNADIDNNGIPDAIFPPDGDLVTPATTGSYFVAVPMTQDGGANIWRATVTAERCGAYRLTARYKNPQSGEWVYCSANGMRDHAVVISPKKVLQQSIYELNGLTAAATAASKEGRSTFNTLIYGPSGTDRNELDEFSIQYLNRIQANCLWFQPIHPATQYDNETAGPGSPYAARDYFAVSKWFGSQTTPESAMSEFAQFVAACDAGKSPTMDHSDVGTINIMLDGVFNHTSWDAVLGARGVELLASRGVTTYRDSSGVEHPVTASTPIGNVRPGWYANYQNYGAPADFFWNSTWHNVATAPDRGDFGKWGDTAELFYGRYAALVEHNDEDNGNYLNEGDWFDWSCMTNAGYFTEELWEYLGSYVEYWLEKTGNDGVNHWDATDDLGIDGLRCDFGQGLPPQFWEYCINRARSHKWNFMFMAETLDGGKVGYRSNRHFDILNESFVFAARNAGSPGDMLAVLDDKKAAYNGGAILLNLTSHDETMPYMDPWMTASRQALLASVKGLPMTFYGQEQGIIPVDTGAHPAQGEEGTPLQPNDRRTGFHEFELNFGKWVAHFKNWNKMTVWDDPPSKSWAGDDGTESRGMAQLYGRINWARHQSPALQSDVQWMLPVFGQNYYSGDIWAMAKAEESGALARGKDAVIALVLFINNGDHSYREGKFSIPAGAASLLGLEAGESYTARNLAAADSDAILWTKTTEELTGTGASDGLWVEFAGGLDGHKLYDDGAMVYFLKLEKAVPPATHTITVTAGTNGSVTPSGAVEVQDGASQAFTIAADAGYRIESVLADGVAVGTFGESDTICTYTWENVTADGTLAATFVEQTVEPTVVPSSGGVDVPVDWMEANYPGMTYEEMLVKVDEPAANGKDAVWQCYIADLDPTDADAAMVVGREIDLSNGVSFKVNVPSGRTAEVRYKDDMTGATQDNWQAFDPAAAYSNEGSAAYEWTFSDPEWDGTTIRFYQLQMRMNP